MLLLLLFCWFACRSSKKNDLGGDLMQRFVGHCESVLLGTLGEVFVDVMVPQQVSSILKWNYGPLWQGYLWLYMITSIFHRLCALQSPLYWCVILFHMVEYSCFHLIFSAILSVKLQSPYSRQSFILMLVFIQFICNQSRKSFLCWSRPYYISSTGEHRSTKARLQPS